MLFFSADDVRRAISGAAEKKIKLIFSGINADIFINALGSFKDLITVALCWAGATLATSMTAKCGSHSELVLP